jgi:hypothetical protein
MDILNKAYYKTLWDNYSSVDSLPTEFTDKASLLSFKFIIESWKKKKPIHVNFQRSENSIIEICQHLYIELSNEIFCNAVDFPPFNAGDRVRSKKKFSVFSGQTKAS